MPIPAVDQKKRRLSAKELVYKTLRDWIIDGTMKPGEVLSDSELSSYFSVSRTPVREAILLLANHRLVEIFPSKETRVSIITKETVFEVYEALAVLSGNIAELALEKMSPKDVEILQQYNDAFIKAIQENRFSDLSDLDNRFHSHISALAANLHLTNFFNDLVLHAYRFENLYYLTGKDKMQSAMEHQAIIDAFKANDKAAVIAASRENWLGFYNRRLKDLI